MALLSQSVESEMRVRQAINQMDFPRVHDLNDAAVAMIASDLDGTFVAGTAFSISAGGELVTNRHVVRTESGSPPRRHPRAVRQHDRVAARRALVRASDDDDLALLQVEGGGPYPGGGGREPRRQRHARRLAGGDDRLSRTRWTRRWRARV